MPHRRLPVADPTDQEPVRILAAHDFPLSSDQVAGVVFAPDRLRGGVYGTAQQMASCLTNRQVARWVTPQGSLDHRRQFVPAHFIRHGGTLYSLSKEGRGTAGPLITALTVAVVEAAETIASTSGRLPVPLLGVLDEAANVCRWRELPNLYSHYGSRGIILMTILQSWAQGVDEFVREMIVRYSGWWESAEAVITLEALWRAWEHLRLDPALGMSVWLRDHLHPHLAVLMSPPGPFGTTSGSAGAASPLPYEAPPAGLFPDVRD